MNGQLANLIQLVAFGNAYLAFGGDEYLAAARTRFNVVYINPEMRFELEQNRFVHQAATKTVARSQAEWFEWLRREKITRLNYVAFSHNADALTEPRAAGFSGGVPMAIQTNGRSQRRELWFPKWDVQPRESEYVWRVSYHGGPSKTDLCSPLKPKNIAPLLADALEQAAAFAESHLTGDNWLTIFRDASAILRTSLSSELMASGLLPQRGYSDDARRLLLAADRAWVFGGMGSWNDLGWPEPEIEAQYNVVTSQLYNAVKTACVVSANAFDSSM